MLSRADVFSIFCFGFPDCTLYLPACSFAIHSGIAFFLPRTVASSGAHGSQKKLEQTGFRNNDVQGRHILFLSINVRQESALLFLLCLFLFPSPFTISSQSVKAHATSG
ncbi:hypothetical protein VNO78_10685 [Psophocarpus tetragonolobus]|uniref:Uncharacterized protein n=1 Tax=Psophocarpus tetragonolobus TaxID=3891 RepID=A0AAN9SMU8_PSOTE